MTTHYTVHAFDSDCDCLRCKHITLALQERPPRVSTAEIDAFDLAELDGLEHLLRTRRVEIRAELHAVVPPGDAQAIAATVRERLFGAQRASTVAAAGDTWAARAATDIDLQRYVVSPARRASLVLAALAARVVQSLLAEQLDDEAALRELAGGDDPAAQRPVLELARHLLAQVDEYFARTARLAPRVRFAGAHVSLAGAFRVEDDLRARVEELTQGLESTLEAIRGGNLDEAIFDGEEVLRGAAR